MSNSLKKKISTGFAIHDVQLGVGWRTEKGNYGVKTKDVGCSFYYCMSPIIDKEHSHFVGQKTLSDTTFN